jgi:hypothetical protein
MVHDGWAKAKPFSGDFRKSRGDGHGVLEFLGCVPWKFCYRIRMNRARLLPLCSLVLPVFLFTGCVTTSPSPRTQEAVVVLQEIPAVPEGWVSIPTEDITFRSRVIKHSGGKWTVNFDSDTIIFVTNRGKQVPVSMEWYPEEGGADAAGCLAYTRGNETLVRLIGSSDFLKEESRFRFEDGILRDVVKYRLPGLGQGPDYPGTPVPANERVKQATF